MTRDFLPFDEEEIEGTIQERFARVVELCPDHPAITMGNRTLSYSELDKASNQIAQAIVAELGVEPEPIPLLFEHGAGIIIALLGVIKAGKFYVAFDLNASRSGMNGTLSDLQTRLILTDRKNYQLAQTLTVPKNGIINIDEVETFDTRALTNVTCTPDTLATITYTSGTTGKPKGAQRTHRQCINTAKTNHTDYRITPQDRVPFIFFFSSGVAVNMLLSLQLSGATVYPYDIKKNGVIQFIQWFIQDKFTVLISSASLFRQFLEHLEQLTDHTELSALHLVIAATEQIYPQDIVRFKEVFPETCRLAHPYGLTETAGVTLLFIDRHTEIPSDIVPVGYPVKDQEVFILIATAITQLDNVRDAIIITRKRQDKDVFLIAYVVPSSGSDLTVSSIRRELAKTIPMWMIPSVFVLLERLPLNTAGKVDRQALPEPDNTRPPLDTPFVPPTTAEEILLAQIWTKTLEVKPVGIHDNFFELGGHSLSMTEVVAQMKQARQVELPLEELFSRPTISELAEWLITH